MKWITTTQILEDLKSSKETLAWAMFRDNFYPLIVNFSKRLGLNDVDAEDAAQEIMLAFIKAFRQGKYCREKGHLSQWLFGIARRVIMDFRRQMPRDRLVAENTDQTSYWDKITDESYAQHIWQSEWRQMVLEKCLQQVRREVDPKAFMAFEQYALCQKPIEEVCRQLSMSQNAVYIAKSRILSRLRQLRQEFEALNEESVL